MTKWLSFLIVLFIAFSCNDAEDDNEIIPENTDLIANASIADLRSISSEDGIYQINESLIVALEVIATDDKDNFFHELVVSDGQSGLLLLLESNSIASQYSVGDNLIVNLEGQFLELNNGSLTIGSGQGDNGELLELSLSDLEDNSQLSTTSLDIETQALSIADLSDIHLNMLVALDDLQFTINQLNGNYAGVSGAVGIRTIENCDGELINIFTLGIADFANESLPNGKGSIVAVYSLINNQKVLRIRDLSEVQMNGDRCTVIPEGFSSLESLRTNFQGGNYIIETTKIKGIVISDRDYGNTDPTELYLQEGNTGVNFLFSFGHSYNVGDELQIELDGNQIIDANGLMRIIGVGPQDITKISQGNEITPLSIDIPTLLQNYNSFESTLIKIDDLSISGDETFSGVSVITDENGNSLAMLTNSDASFASQTLVPSAFSITGIASDFEGPTLVVRSLLDIDSNPFGGGSTQMVSIEELRQDYTNGFDELPTALMRGVVISDFENKNVLGNTLVLQQDAFGIEVVLDGDHSFPLGVELELDLSSGEYNLKNGLLQITGVLASQVTNLGLGLPPLERFVSIEDIINDPSEFESTLVTIPGVSFTDGTIYMDDPSISDGSGSLVLDTHEDAVFASDTVSDDGVSIRGIISFDGEVKLMLRNLFDIVE